MLFFSVKTNNLVLSYSAIGTWQTCSLHLMVRTLPGKFIEQSYMINIVKLQRLNNIQHSTALLPLCQVPGLV